MQQRSDRKRTTKLEIEDFPLETALGSEALSTLHPPVMMHRVSDYVVYRLDTFNTP
jgi:hypothetical protein